MTTTNTTYTCTNCGHTLQSSDLISIRCPECGYKGLDYNRPADTTSELRERASELYGKYWHSEMTGQEFQTAIVELIAAQKQRWSDDGRKEQATSDLQVVFDIYSGSISPDFAFELMKERIAKLGGEDGQNSI